MIELSIVSYLNSLPFLHGLRNSQLAGKLSISEDAPSVCAEKILSGNADIGLVPVAILPQLPEYTIAADYCIGCEGAVYSVLLLSDVPLEEIQQVKLDYQSRTSVQLVRILAQHHWKISPEWLAAEKGFEGDITGTTAGVVIGDRAMVARKNHPYVYDLGEAWLEMTGLPFVFAVWISTRPIDNAIKDALNRAFAWGIQRIPELTTATDVPFLSTDELNKYLQQYIRYEFGIRQQEGMRLFLDYLRLTDLK